MLDILSTFGTGLFHGDLSSNSLCCNLEDNFFKKFGITEEAEEISSLIVVSIEVVVGISVVVDSVDSGIDVSASVVVIVVVVSEVEVVVVVVSGVVIVSDCTGGGVIVITGS